jgi:hypothetical protein
MEISEQKFSVKKIIKFFYKLFLILNLKFTPTNF